jgi:hypothetical protein
MSSSVGVHFQCAKQQTLTSALRILPVHMVGLARQFLPAGRAGQMEVEVEPAADQKGLCVG